MAIQGYILVVDDDKVFVDLTGEHLAWAKARIVTAGDAVEAYKKALAETPALVVLDVNMPGFGSGLDALRSFRAEPTLQAVPVLIVTGLPPDRLRNADIPSDRIFYKPVDWGAFNKAVRAALMP